MDERDLIAQKIDAERVATRAELSEALRVSIPSIGRLLRKERKLSAKERDAAFQLLGITADDGVRWSPVLGDIGAGDWRAAMNLNEPIGYMPCTQGGSNTFGLIVIGDSMNLVAPGGARIAVDPDNRNLVNGSYYAVLNDADEATFKRFKTDPARFEPVSDNPNHKPILIGSDDFKVIGKVVQIIFEPD